MNAALQWLVVGLLLAWSLGAMLARFFPAPAARLRAAGALAAERHGLPRLAARLRALPASGGCDSGCGSCKTGCGTPALPAARETAAAPVRWRP